jgi:hypothetical protein
MADRKDIATVIVTVTNIHTGEEIEPIYEAYGYEKFQEFVTWYQENIGENKIARVKGIAYEDGKSIVVASEFVGAKIPAIF